MSEINWRKSSYSGAGDGNSCIELAFIGTTVALRESDDPRTVLTTSPARLGALLQSIKTGTLDHLAAVPETTRTA
ncbi:MULTISPECIES: DUF397 domain-containing protein [Streptomyces]|uniref:DUF397 domain-containing protein n=1 Tax=Streptomyces violaceusniger TaxID=68280 RepID=A0A4D4LCR4_STRVO|nr:DUF397 domain-containing protein [Streptomyces sp. 5-6(2022)]GDY55749.1 hypothetical protein SVIO_063720 [Streptomyces violaceusniger]